MYIGYSSNLRERIAVHQKNRVNSTMNRKPTLLWYAAFSSQYKAIRFEKYLKSSSGFAFRNKHLI